MRTSRIYCLESGPAVYKYSLKFLIQKNSKLLDKLNAFILMASQSGLISKWTNYNGIRFHLHDTIEETKIRLSDLLIICIIGFIMLIFAGTALIFEKIVHQHKSKPNANLVWIYADILIDYERHYLLEKIKTN